MSRKFSQKVAALGLALTTAAWVGGAVLIAPASAATTADIQAQIQALQAQLATLEAQLTATSGTSTTSSATCTFTRSLTLRSVGSDVKCLQEYLNASGYAVATTGAGSVGHETTYFGPATKAAVAKWQAANSVTPAVGYFGPISRAEYVKLTAGTSTGSTTGSTGSTGSTTGNVPASGLAASLASNSAAAGSIIAGAGQIPVGSFTFTASNAKGETVTGLTFTKVGVVSDSNITNGYLADSTGNVVAQYQSLSSGVMTFTGLNFNVAAGASATYTLKVDLSSSASAGNTIAWQLTGVTVSSGDTVTGTPVTAATQTVTTVSNPSISTATFTFNSVGSSVNAGTTGVLVSDITANVTNNAVYLKGMKFTMVGSANTSDLQNLKLMVGGTQVGSTVSSVSSDGSLYFNLSSSNVKLLTGNTDIQLYADIMGSPNRTAQFTILHTYNVNVVDSQYNSGIAPSVTTTNATTINISKGTLTVNTDSATPTGNVAEGVSAVTLAKFDVKAAGEAVRINYMDAKIAGTGWTAITNATADLTNVRIIDNAGGQVGNTISTIASGSTTGDCTYASAAVTCHFGDSSSNINYTIPANTTRTLSVVADLASTMTATALQASLPGNTGAAVGQISNQTTDVGSATGASLTVVTNSLTSATNSGLSTQTFAAGATGVTVGSFTLTASAAQSVNVSSLTITTGVNASLKLQNMKLMVNGSQWGSPVSTITTSAATAYTFSGSSPINVAAGGVVTVNVAADILSSSSAATYAGAVSLTSWTATGGSSGSSIAFDASRTGQSVIVSSGPTLTLTADNNTPQASQVAMGSTGNTLAIFDLTNNNVEAVNVSKIKVTDTIANNSGTTLTSFTNMTLYNQTTGHNVQTGLPMIDVSATSSYVTFNPATPISVAKNQTVVLALKGDVATVSSGAAEATSTHTFNVATTTDVTALGASSNDAATVSGTPTGQAFTVLQNVMNVAAAQLVTTPVSKTANDNIGTITVSSPSSNTSNLYLQKIKVTFSGSAASTSNFLSGLTLLDQNSYNASTTDSGSFTSSAACSGGSSTCSATWTFGSSAGSGYLLTPGSSYKFTLQVNDNDTQTMGANLSAGLTASVNAAGDVTYSDGVSNGTSIVNVTTSGGTISIPPTNIASFSYVSGT